MTGTIHHRAGPAPFLVAALGLCLAIPALAQDYVPAKGEVEPPRREYSPYVDDYYPNRVYFGDIHLHSDWSTDAGMAGATLGPDAAYRASRGEVVTAHSGYRFKLVHALPERRDR